MADIAHELEGFVCLFGAKSNAVERVEVAVEELDGFEQAAGRDALPDFAEAAGAQRADEAIAGQRFAVGFAQPAHGDDSVPIVRQGSSMRARRPTRAHPQPDYAKVSRNWGGVNRTRNRHACLRWGLWRTQTRNQTF